MSGDEGWLSAREAAALLGLHVNTLKRWAAIGSAPPHYRLGDRGDLRFRRADLMAWLEARRVG